MRLFYLTLAFCASSLFSFFSYGGQGDPDETAGKEACSYFKILREGALKHFYSRAALPELKKWPTNCLQDAFEKGCSDVKDLQTKGYCRPAVLRFAGVRCPILMMGTLTALGGERFFKQLESCPRLPSGTK